MRLSDSPTLTCSRKVAISNPGDLIQLLDEREYRALRTSMHSGTVVLQRADASANQRSFTSQPTATSLLTVTTLEASVSLNEPTDNCLCELPSHPDLPDGADTTNQCKFDIDETLSTNVLRSIRLRI